MTKPGPDGLYHYACPGCGCDVADEWPPTIVTSAWCGACTTRLASGQSG